MYVTITSTVAIISNVDFITCDAPWLQVLLAIAAGAMLVTPDWLTASLEAGEWLPEEPYLAQVSPPALYRPLPFSIDMCTPPILLTS